MNLAFGKRLYTFLGIWLFCITLTAQQYTPSTEILLKYHRAVSYLDSFKNDQALILLNETVSILDSANGLNSPFGLRVLFRQAEALEKDHKDEEALIQLRKVKDQGFEDQVWDVYANASLILARLYEKIGRDSLCLVNLMDAREAIHTNAEIDSLYPLFSIRFSSYNRIFANPDTALFYAKEVLRTAPLYRQVAEKGVGHMLMGMMAREGSPKSNLYHYKEAANIFKKIDDHTGYSFMMGNITNWHLRQRQPKQALIYNDSNLIAAYRSINNGHEERRTLYYPLRTRANIFKSLNQFDSAWHYMNLSYQTEINYMHQSNNEKVIAAEARYQDEKKSQKIIEQANTIAAEKTRRKTLMGIGSIILFFTGLLAMAYFRLKTTNSKVTQQASTIQTKNKELSNSLEQQTALQGEVHHRVKNNLQVIISLLDKQKEQINDPVAKKHLLAMGNRIHSMAAIHEILYRQEDMSKVDLQEYVGNLCLEFSNFSLENERPIFNQKIGPYHFNLETSMPIGIILTELLMNSVKYARQEGQRLKIDIELKKVGSDFCFLYRDNGPGFPPDFLIKKDNGGLGSYLLNSMTRQLNGQYELGHEGGAEFKLFFKEKNA